MSSTLTNSNEETDITSGTEVKGAPITSPFDAGE